MRWIFTLILPFLPFMANAAITITSIENASYYTDTEVAGKWIVYGGTSGDVDRCVRTETNTICDSCLADSGEPSPCNSRRIFPELKLRINFKSDSAEAVSGATAKMIRANARIGAATPQPILQNAESYVEVTWSELCSAIAAGSDCTSSVSVADINIGVDKANDDTLEDSLTISVRIASPSSDKNFTSDCLADPEAEAVPNEGACSFAVEAGDEKMVVTGAETIVPATTYPTSSETNTNWHSLRFYYVEADPDAAIDFSTIKMNSAFVDLELDVEKNDDGTSDVFFDNNTIEGLTNGQFYCFRLANVDRAGNIYRIMQNTTLTTYNGAGPDFMFCGTPDEVVGLLKDQKCFIATATYGSPLAPQVNLLRKFRNQYLVPYKWGRAFVKTYYKYSPKLARTIEHSPFLKTASWMLLAPVIALVGLWMSGYFWLLGLAGFATWLGLRLRRRKRA